MTVTPDVLQAFVAAPGMGKDDIAAPLGVEAAGVRWLAAADGWRLFAVADDAAPTTRNDLGVSSMIARALAAPMVPVTFTWPASLDPLPALPPCSKCKGKPRPVSTCRDCNGEGRCTHCDDGDCPTCDGEGAIGGCTACGDTGEGVRSATDVPVIVVNGVGFDAQLLVPLLNAVAGDGLCCTVPSPGEPWMLRRPGVVAAIMLRKYTTEPVIATLAVTQC